MPSGVFYNSSQKKPTTQALCVIIYIIFTMCTTFSSCLQHNNRLTTLFPVTLELILVLSLFGRLTTLSLT